MPNELLDASIYQKTANFFKAMADETRVKIIWSLSKEELCVGDLANLLEMTQSAISHQLSTLRKANLVVYRKKGKEVFYYLKDDHVRKMLLSGIEHVHD